MKQPTKPTQTHSKIKVVAKPVEAKPAHPNFSTPFNEYFHLLDAVDGKQRYNDEFGSILILALVEEVGEMARAYLAKHGRKKHNLAAQNDESYKQELGDLLVTILRIARIKKINLDERIRYTIEKVKERKLKPKE